MFRNSNQSRLRRRAMSLVELLAVAAILVMMAGTLGSLSLAVQSTHTFQATRGMSLQHGQVVLQRIQRHLQEATCNANFPGMVVFAESVGGESFPDTLVIWDPSGLPVDASGLPRINELIVYSPNPSLPRELWEITKPLDMRVAPALSDATAWRTELNSFRTDTSAVRNVITDLLRVASIRDTNNTVTATRAVLRFHVLRRPSATDWQEFQAGRLDWDDMPWVQGIYGSTTGLSQVRCHIELQLCPADVRDNSRDAAIPFFGSGAAYFQLTRTL